MPTLESRIDELYKGSLGEFVAARTALAKTLTGDEARRVKSLSKPTVVPWAVNQVYWHARDVYSRVLKAGEKLRDAQLTALKGKASDVRGATTAHRQAVADAVKTASRLATGAGARPDPEPLARMFEAVSLQQTPPEPHGRFTKPLQPQGFEALAGVAIKAVPPSIREPEPKAPPHAPASERERAKPTAEEAREIRRREHEAAMAARQHEAALKLAETKLSHARDAEAKARADWQRATRELKQAERRVAARRCALSFSQCYSSETAVNSASIEILISSPTTNPPVSRA